MERETLKNATIKWKTPQGKVKVMHNVEVEDQGKAYRLKSVILQDNSKDDMTYKTRSIRIWKKDVLSITT